MTDRLARRRQRLRARQADRFGRMAEQVHVHNPFYRAKWQAAGFDSPPTLDDLTDLPFTTKAELAGDQDTNPPRGSNLTFPFDRYVRVHRTSGTTGKPLRWFDTPASWQWFLDCWLETYRGAGVGPDDRVFVAFGFGPFVGFWTAFEAAQQLGCLVMPGGHLSTEQRLNVIREEGATVLVATPTYALRLLEVARELDVDLAGSSIERTIHGGEPGAGVPAVKRQLAEGFGARVFDHAGATEVGAWGYPCGVGEHLHVFEEEFIVEWLDRTTGELLPPLDPGARESDPSLGELVLTNLGRIGSPVVRYRSGDVGRLCAAGCSCGRPTVYLDGGVRARADDMFIVRGVNVYPSSIDAMIREAGGVAEYRATVRERRQMVEVELEVEPEPGREAEVLRLGLQDLFQRRLSLRIPVRIAATGSLPRYELKANRFTLERP
ncbi:MAG: AMP-binding protein [Acidobacteria bacterium]|nr:AMP-binding protein [Acidobacteriota bacterium]